MNNYLIIIKNRLKYFLSLFLVCFFSFQNLNAQCSVVDTVCVTDSDTLFINIQSNITSHTWYTDNGATITVLPGDTAIIVDWSTSTILNGVDEVFLIVSASPDCEDDTASFQVFLEECIEPCLPNIFHQAIKRSGSPTLCDIILADNTHPLAAADCDGGGVSNLDECLNGLDPEDPIDDNLPESCTAGPSYYLGFDNHAFEPQQVSGNTITGTFPIGLVTFQDCMMPQPTPATLTVTGQPFCLGGIKDANMITSANWSIANLGACGIQGATQANADNPTLCEVIIDRGLASQQVFTTSVGLVSPGGLLTGGAIKDALEAANILPACMIATGGTVAGVSTNEAQCVDYNGANWQYTIDCSCKLANGSIPTSVTMKVCQDSGDYAHYLMKIL